MADYTIVIKDKTSKRTGKEVTTNDVKPDGTVKEKKSPKITPPKKDKPKAAEPNRVSRVINSTFNKFTNGMWEKGKRLYSATTAVAMSGSVVGGVIIAQMVVNTIKAQYDNYVRQAEERNQQDILRMRTGTRDIAFNQDYDVNFWTGRVHYKNNR
jgi:hypothetical protein